MELGSKHVVEREHEFLQRPAAACKCRILVTALFVTLESRSLCGYLLSPVGTSSVTREMIIRTVMRQRRLLIFHIGKALLSLHRHTPDPIFHGNARIDNLIMSTDSPPHLFSVDVMEARMAPTIGSASFSKDSEVLVKSIVGCDYCSNLPLNMRL